MSATSNSKKNRMKKLFILSLMVLCFAAAEAQKYDDIKLKLTLNQLTLAKDELEKNWATAKFTTKPEAYMLRAAIYAAIGADELAKKSAGADKYVMDADAAFLKYREMDAALTIVDDPIYQNAPINLYSNFYSSGYADYSAKNWASAYEKFKKAVYYSDFLISKKLINGPVDTNVLILAGIVAENYNKKDDAVVYYSRLADNKVVVEGFESVYRFLVSYYFAKKDIPQFEKYKALGKQLYPNVEYFSFDKIDFAVGLSPNFDEKLKSVEEVLVSDPENFKANQVLGEIIYDTLNPKDETTPRHSNADALEQKMAAAFAKAAAAQPTNELPLIYSGDHFINRAVMINKEREAHAADMKSRTKPGTMSSKEDVAKRDALDKKYGDALESARGPYEKAAAIFATKPKSDDKNQALRDKTQYKKVASYLADIYAYKKLQAKGKAAEQAKYAAEEKKWNDLWDSIK